MKLTDIATVIRSKNAGPFLLTLDIMFKDRFTYEKFKEAGLMTKQRAADIYGIEVDDIQSVTFFDPADAVKITFTRPIVSGGPGDTDIYGAQQHVPLINWEFSLNL